jgi:hypothetical protein
MAYTYEIRIAFGKMDNSVCPPACLKDVFPTYSGETVELSEQYCRVTFATQQTPADLGPLVRVELITQ